MFSGFSEPLNHFYLKFFSKLKDTVYQKFLGMVTLMKPNHLDTGWFGDIASRFNR